MEGAACCCVGVGAAKEEVAANCGAGLPGFRFHPTDEELVSFYLRKRVLHQHGEKDHTLLALQYFIPDLDIYKYDPWDLPKLARLGEGLSGCYFFSPRDRKYRNSTRPNRVTLSGFWKATGTDRFVYSGASTSECAGLKKSLVFYLGRASRGTKTDWMMHEFRLPGQPDCGQKDTCWALCKIFKRKSNNPQYTSETQAFLAEDLPCAAEANLEKLEVLDSFVGEDCNEEDLKSENTVCTSLTPTCNGPVPCSVDICTLSSCTSQGELATEGSSELTGHDVSSSMKRGPLTVRVSKSSNIWTDDLLREWFSPTITTPCDSSRISGQPCFSGDANFPFTDQTFQESLQMFTPGHLFSSPLWNPTLPLWDQPSFFHDSMSFNTLS